MSDIIVKVNVDLDVKSVQKLYIHPNIRTIKNIYDPHLRLDLHRHLWDPWDGGGWARGQEVDVGSRDQPRVRDGWNKAWRRPGRHAL